MSTGPLWGCLECGALSSAPNRQHRCPECGDGLLTELGGLPSPQKAQALLTWARREVTLSIENVITVAGCAVGLALGMAAMGVAEGMAKILVVMHATVLAGLVARLFAMRIHRWVRPRNRLQPVHNFAQRRLAWVGLGLWVALPVVAFTLLKVWRAGPVGSTLRHAAGSLWAWLGG